MATNSLHTPALQGSVALLMDTRRTIDKQQKMILQVLVAETISAACIASEEAGVSAAKAGSSGNKPSNRAQAHSTQRSSQQDASQREPHAGGKDTAANCVSVANSVGAEMFRALLSEACCRMLSSEDNSTAASGSTRGEEESGTVVAYCSTSHTCQRGNVGEKRIREGVEGGGSKKIKVEESEDLSNQEATMFGKRARPLPRTNPPPSLSLRYLYF